MFKALFGDKIWCFGVWMNDGAVMKPIQLLLAIVAIMAIAYMLGNVNTAILLTKLIYKEDIRTKGSGNPGMTNVMRNYGWLPALVTLIGDMAKCMLAMTAGTLIYGLLGAYIAGLFCVLGHIAPIIYGFKGGKGVSSSAMFVLYVNPVAFLIVFGIFALILMGPKYLSLSSVGTVGLMPIILYRIESIMNPTIAMYYAPIKVAITLLIAFVVIYMHRENIKRIMNKTERRFSFKRTVKKGQEMTEVQPVEPLIEEDDEYEYIYEELTDEVVARKEQNRKKSKSKKK